MGEAVTKVAKKAHAEFAENSWRALCSPLRSQRFKKAIPRQYISAMRICRALSDGVWQRFLATSPSRSCEAEQQRKPFEDWGSFPLALPRGSEAATFVRSTPGGFVAPSATKTGLGLTDNRDKQ